jgi:hypothetical protein
MNLDIEKAYELYSKITNDKYRYNDNIEDYNKIVSIMDRLISSAQALNRINIDPKITNNIDNFILWINYADLLLASFKGIEKIYGYSLKQRNNFFFNYHKLPKKNDNDYFRFIRAIILPHALELDDKEQIKFTNNKKAYCPSLCYGGKSDILIKYFIDDVNNHEHYISLKIQDFCDYIEDLYNGNIENIQFQVKKVKIKRKAKLIQQALAENYKATKSIEDKLIQLNELVRKYGTLEDKKGISALTSALDTANEIVKFNFNKANISVINEYIEYLDKSLDNLFEYICNKTKDYEMFYELIVPHFNYTYNYKEFNNCGYEIGKITCEYKSFDDFIESCYFKNWKQALTKHLEKYVIVTEDMSMREFCLLTIICFALYKIKHADLGKIFNL